MSLLTALNRIDKRYAWSLLGFVLAVVFGTLSVYTEFLRDRRPELRFELLSDASVLDLREKLGDLEIVYDGVDIQKAKKSLRVIVVRVTNLGPDDILKSHYDEKTPLGMRALKGTLLRADILSSSNPYLRQTLRIHLQPPDTALFDPVILEANEWFTIKSLILHPEGARPELEPIGKVAGVREIRRVDLTEAAAEPSFLAQTFSGGVWVQAARLVSYFFGLIAVLLGVGAPIAAASEALARRRRRRHVAQFKSITKLVLTDQDEFIFERYVENDIGYLRMLQGAAENEGRLDFEVRRYERRKQTQPDNEESDHTILMSSTGAPPPRFFQGRLPIRDMQKSGLILKTDNGWLVDPHLKQTLQEFIRFLEIKRAI